MSELPELRQGRPDRPAPAAARGAGRGCARGRRRLRRARRRLERSDAADRGLDALRATASAGVAVSQTTPEKAVAETTDGVAVQRHGAARNPSRRSRRPTAKHGELAARASPPARAAPAPALELRLARAHPPTGSSGSGSSGGSAPTTPSKPSTPAKPKTVYHVAVLFGVLPAGATPQTAQLTPYESLKLLDAAAVGQAAADRLPRRHRRRQERDLHARRRSDPARRRRLPAERRRSARRST